MSAFKRAVKSQSKLRLALFGPSGSGKTYTALRIATGMGGPIALIDTEHQSASLYADRFAFDAAELTEPTIENMVAKIEEAKGYGVLIIDSLSHSWQELLQEVDRLAKSKYKGNSWSAWSDGTPRQKKLVEALLSFPGHIVATMRSKTEWETSKDERTGKAAPIRVGLAPEQGKGIEYEFSMLMEMSVDHVATIIKDRTGKYQDKMIEKPTEAFGQELIAWLNTGEAAVFEVGAPKEQPAPVQKQAAPVQPKPAAKTPTKSPGARITAIKTSPLMTKEDKAAFDKDFPKSTNDLPAYLDGWEKDLADRIAPQAEPVGAGVTDAAIPF